MGLERVYVGEWGLYRCMGGMIVDVEIMFVVRLA